MGWLKKITEWRNKWIWDLHLWSDIYLKGIGRWNTDVEQLKTEVSYLVFRRKRKWKLWMEEKICPNLYCEKYAENIITACVLSLRSQLVCMYLDFLHSRKLGTYEKSLGWQSIRKGTIKGEMGHHKF